MGSRIDRDGFAEREAPAGVPRRTAHGRGQGAAESRMPLYNLVCSWCIFEASNVWESHIYAPLDSGPADLPSLLELSNPVV